MINQTIVVSLLCIVLVSGCTGFQTLGLVARPDDTVAIGIGWHTNLSRQDITISITAANGIEFTYLPGDPRVRALINQYPDPLAYLLVGMETGQNLSAIEPFYGFLLESSVTGGDKDYAETLLVLDMPNTIATGTATITVIPASAPSIGPFNVDILPGMGTPHDFNSQELSLTDQHVRTLERAPNYEITFSGTTVPHAIQLVLTHDPDSGSGGSGVPYVVNPRGDIKSINWSDDGTAMTVIMLPASGDTLADMILFKFYVTGGITGLMISSVHAYNIDGNLIPGITASIN